MSMDPNIWVETLPKSKKNLKEENYDLNANKWINSIPKKRTNFSKIKYSFTILLFVSSLVAVPLIKNVAGIYTLNKKGINNSVFLNYDSDFFQIQYPDQL